MGSGASTQIPETVTSDFCKREMHGHPSFDKQISELFGDRDALSKAELAAMLDTRKDIYLSFDHKNTPPIMTTIKSALEHSGYMVSIREDVEEQAVSDKRLHAEDLIDNSSCVVILVNASYLARSGGSAQDGAVKFDERIAASKAGGAKPILTVAVEEGIAQEHCDLLFLESNIPGSTRTLCSRLRAMVGCPIMELVHNMMSRARLQEAKDQETTQDQSQEEEQQQQRSQQQQQERPAVAEGQAAPVAVVVTGAGGVSGPRSGGRRPSLLARRGAVDEQAAMARLYDDFMNGKAKAFDALLTEAIKDNHLADAYLKIIYWDGYGAVKKDHSKSREHGYKVSPWLQDAATAGDRYAQYIMGFCSEHSIPGAKPGMDEALRMYRRSAMQHYLPAVLAMGECYYYGSGVEQNYAEAEKWYQEGAESQHAGCLFALGYSFDEGRGKDVDKSKAVEFYRAAAVQGYSQAQCNLGVILLTGAEVSDVTSTRVVERNAEEGVRLLRLAAENGSGYAEYHLGNCYRDGVGVNVSTTSAAGGGGPIGSEGGGEEKYGENSGGGSGGSSSSSGDHDAAIHYRAGAELGCADAQYEYALCCETGRGLKVKNMDEAKKWFAAALKQGCLKARGKVKGGKGASHYNKRRGSRDSQVSSTHAPGSGLDGSEHDYLLTGQRKRTLKNLFWEEQAAIGYMYDEYMQGKFYNLSRLQAASAEEKFLADIFLAMLYLEGYGALAVDEERGREYVRRAISHGLTGKKMAGKDDGYVQFVLGWCYVRGVDGTAFPAAEAENRSKLDLEQQQQQQRFGVCPGSSTDGDDATPIVGEEIKLGSKDEKDLQQEPHLNKCEEPDSQSSSLTNLHLNLSEIASNGAQIQPSNGSPGDTDPASPSIATAAAGSHAKSPDKGAAVSGASNYVIVKKEKEGIKHLKHALKKGCMHAAKALGDLYFYGGGRGRDMSSTNNSRSHSSSNIVQSYEEAQSWYLHGEAASPPHAGCVYMLALACDEGLGRPVDKPKAEVHYRVAAGQCHPYARCKLGILLLLGSEGEAGSVPMQPVEAIELLQLAAEQRVPAAEHYLGLCYLGGNKKLVDPSILKPSVYDAAIHFKIAADWGDPNAQFELGYCYEVGLGVEEKSIDIARKWYALAAAQGHQKAAERLANKYHL